MPREKRDNENRDSGGELSSALVMLCAGSVGDKDRCRKSQIDGNRSHRRVSVCCCCAGTNLKANVTALAPLFLLLVTR